MKTLSDCEEDSVAMEQAIIVDRLINEILTEYPKTQAIYLFGSWGTESQHSNSDLDIAVLLPYPDYHQIKPWAWYRLMYRLAILANVKQADLINLRQADDILRWAVISADRLIWSTDEAARINFEALAFSLYDELQYQRQGIIDDAIKSGRFLHEKH